MPKFTAFYKHTAHDAGLFQNPIFNAPEYSIMIDISTEPKSTLPITTDIVPTVFASSTLISLILSNEIVSDFVITL